MSVAAFSLSSHVLLIDLSFGFSYCFVFTLTKTALVLFRICHDVWLKVLLRLFVVNDNVLMLH